VFGNMTIRRTGKDTIAMELQIAGKDGGSRTRPFASSARRSRRCARERRNVFLLACCQALLLTNAVTLIAIGALAGYALADNKASHAAAAPTSSALRSPRSRARCG
jgi:hypothetical protein